MTKEAIRLAIAARRRLHRRPAVDLPGLLSIPVEMPGKKGPALSARAFFIRAGTLQGQAAKTWAAQTGSVASEAHRKRMHVANQFLTRST